KSKTSLSRASVVVPGRTCLVKRSSASAASCPARRIPANASGPCNLIWPALRPATSTELTNVIVSGLARLFWLAYRFTVNLSHCRAEARLRAEPPQDAVSLEESSDGLEERLTSLRIP